MRTSIIIMLLLSMILLSGCTQPLCEITIQLNKIPNGTTVETVAYYEDDWSMNMNSRHIGPMLQTMISSDQPPYKIVQRINDGTAEQVIVYTKNLSLNYAPALTTYNYQWLCNGTQQ